MGTYENKIVQVYPSELAEQRAIQAYEAGCWELMSCDRIQEVHGDTRSTFTRLRFRRDKDMPHYYEISQASYRAEYLSERKANTKKSSCLVLLSIAFAILAFYSFFSLLIVVSESIGSKTTATNDYLIFIGVGILWATFVVLFIFFLVRGLRGGKRKEAAYEKEYNEELQKLKSFVASLK